MLQPGFSDFHRLAAAGGLVPVWREFLFDADTAVTAYYKLARSLPSPSASASPHFGFLLESVVGGEKWARYTFLGTAPREAWKLEAGGRISRWLPETGWSETTTSPDPLADFDRLLHQRRPVSVPRLPRFFGGAVGYLGYDVVRYIERLPAAPPDDTGLPEALFLFTDVVLAIDNVFGRARAIAVVETDGADAAELRRRYDEAAEKLDAVVTTLAEAHGPEPLALEAAEADPPFQSSYTRAAFEEHVRRIKEYIAAGDAFQVVLSQRLTVPLEARPFDLYRALRSLNPSPYLYYLDLDGLALVGSSPEVLVRVEDGQVTVRPIAGTRPRGQTEQEDATLTAELLSDEKERAEHLMLVDLGRNDVGRVARYGSVRVPEYMAVERYSHVLHLVSQVEGRLRDGLSAMDAFRACFPAGTVTGAPKIRAMQIIDELEPVRRGPYAGAVGYFAYGGQTMDAAIAIRTLVAAQGRAHVQAGAGVVADSIPEREYQETLAKARALLRVLRMVPRAAAAESG
ncbi:MAG: anthranilate synthase component I [Gemmatimonadetes bacterium]|nr:anthranilate synthase component I [Gemmatimonadota bacterium]